MKNDAPVYVEVEVKMIKWCVSSGKTLDEAIQKVREIPGLVPTGNASFDIDDTRAPIYAPVPGAKGLG